MVIDTNKVTTANLPINTAPNGAQYYIQLSSESIQQVKLLPIISWINLVWKNLVPASNSAATIYSASLAAGSYTIALASPPQSKLTISGATFSTPANWNNAGAWIVSFTVSTPGTVTIQSTGAMFEQDAVDPTVNGLYDISLPYPRSIEIDLSVQNGHSDLNNLGAWIMSYYNQRYYQKSTVYSQICHAGDIIKIDSQNGKQILGCIETASIELVGLRSEIEVVGVLL